MLLTIKTKYNDMVIALKSLSGYIADRKTLKIDLMFKGYISYRLDFVCKDQVRLDMAIEKLRDLMLRVHCPSSDDVLDDFEFDVTEYMVNE